MKVTFDLLLILKWIILFPVVLVYCVSILMGLVIDLFLTPFRWMAVFLFGLTKEMK